VERLLSDLSPENFLAPFSKALDAARLGVGVTQQALATQHQALDAQAGLVRSAKDAVDSLNRAIADLNGQWTDAEQRLVNSIARKTDLLNNGLDKITVVGGHFEQPTIDGPFGIKIPVGPPIWVPAIIRPNPEYDGLLSSIESLNRTVTDLHSQITQLEQQKEAALRGQSTALANRAEALTQVGLAEAALNAARAELDKAQTALVEAQTIVSAFVSGIPIPVSS
jgi:chromosome segregation ATPase